MLSLIITLEWGGDDKFMFNDFGRGYKGGNLKCILNNDFEWGERWRSAKFIFKFNNDFGMGGGKLIFKFQLDAN